MNIKVRKFLLVILVAVFLASALPTPASAGTNGQQLKIRFSGIYCTQKWTVTVKGPNQNGVFTTWTKTQIPTMVGLSTCEIKTTNSWWKGSVTVSGKSLVAGPYTKVVSVPKVQYTSNWYIVKLR